MGLRKYNGTKTIFYIPETREEWEDAKQTLIKAHGLEDSPETWTFVLSHLQNVKMPELTTTMKYIVDHYKRWKIAKFLQEEKQVYINQLQDKLKALLQAQEGAQDEGQPSSAANGDLPSGAFCSQGDMPPLPGPQEDMVQTPS